MTYTFLHAGVPIGESDLEDRSGKPRQRGGVFRPTPYGLELFPRLSGILSAGYALKQHLESLGVSEDDLSREEVEELMDTSEAGKKILDIGRVLSDVEVVGPDGERVEFASIAFTDALEMHRITRALDVSVDLPAFLPPGTPRYFVSATFRKRLEPAGHAGRGGTVRSPWRH